MMIKFNVCVVVVAAVLAISHSVAGQNLMGFTEALHGIAAPAVSQQGPNQFTCAGVNGIFNDLLSALSRSCETQYNLCADAANAAGNPVGFTVAFCYHQLTDCFNYILGAGTSGPPSNCQPVYGQCGGIGWTGSTCCQSGSTCQPQAGNPYYSQCLPGSAPSPGTTPAPAPATPTPSPSPNPSPGTPTPAPTTGSGNGSDFTIVPGGLSGNGVTTRYWDCSKPSCSWPGKAIVTAPVTSCAIDGVTPVDPNTQSGSNGGAAFSCTNNQPFVSTTNPLISYILTSVAFPQGESRTCCACFQLQFTSGPLVGSGKSLVVQVTNTGGDVGSTQFDLQMPGGGIGAVNSCTAQFNAGANWGAQYGGVSSAAQCSNLPAALQPGCLWRFGWFGGSDNPSIQYTEITCPVELTSITGCIRD